VLFAVCCLMLNGIIHVTRCGSLFSASASLSLVAV
jgi:hypothetical protein